MSAKLDREIIRLLKRDGRCSCAAMARELGVNVATVSRRIDYLLAEDYVSVKTVLNPFGLGFNAHSFVTLDINLSLVDQICRQLVDSLNISLVATAFGRYDVLLLVDFPEWQSLQEYIAQELPGIKGISKINSFPVIEIKKLYNGLFTYSWPVAKPAVLDEIDRAIIRELGKNGRLPFTDLAARLNTSLTTVSRRVGHLRREGILGISAVRNPSKWGYSANAYISIHADPSKVHAICTKLSAYPEIHLIMTAMSGFEILIGIHSPNSEQMYRFVVDNIARIDGVSNIETFVCAEIRKRAYAIFDSAGEG